MRLPKIFRKTTSKERPGKFSDFLLHAPEDEKREVLTEAARQSNEEQKEIFRRAQLKEKAS